MERDHGYIIADSSDNTMYRMIVFESAIDICYLEKIEYDENVAGGSGISYASAVLSEVFNAMKIHTNNTEIIKAYVNVVEIDEKQHRDITVKKIDRDRFQKEIKVYNIELVNL